MQRVFFIRTDTSTLCLFDPEVIRSRLMDSADWWSDPYEELNEVNLGNILIIGLGSDGIYSVELFIREHANLQQKQLAARIKCLSGVIYIGPGEDITGDGIEPSERSSGEFIHLEKGTWLAEFIKKSENALALYLNPIEGNSINSFKKPLDIDTTHP